MPRSRRILLRPAELTGEKPGSAHHPPCPGCGRTDVHASRGRGLGRLLIFSRTYHCPHCDRRYRALSRTKLRRALRLAMWGAGLALAGLLIAGLVMIFASGDMVQQVPPE